MIDARDLVRELKLEVLNSGNKRTLKVVTVDVNRPGLILTGFNNYFANERPQVLGRVEMTYLESLTSQQRKERLCQFFASEVPFVVIGRGIECPPELLECARESQTPLYRSESATTTIFMRLINYLNSKLAPRITSHGVLVDVYGVGILLTGDSGVGKSESALELVKRGHRLVADDVVDICRVSDTRVIGEAPEMIRHFMEIRGIGIIDVRSIYGIGSVINQKSIDIEIHLELWDSAKQYDRLGDTEDFEDILGVKIPKIVLPVRPGRNIAIVVEVAARNFRLKAMGFNALKELDLRRSDISKRSSYDKEHDQDHENQMNI